MRRILVTGASGFVGGHLRPVLRDAFPAAELIAATRGKAAPCWDRVMPLDLLDAASCVTALRTAQPDAVIHLAAMAETSPVVVVVEPTETQVVAGPESS